MEDIPLEPIPQQPARRPVAPPVVAHQQTSGLAITSLVLACLSFLCLPILGPLSIIFGIMALRRIKASHGRLSGGGLAIAGITVGAVLTLLLTPALLLPAIQAAREAARRNASMNNMKQIAIALQNYHDIRNAFPAARNEGGSQLSWRVHILPYIEEDELYAQFHLDEPWDSEHNKTLIARMPSVFENPNHVFPAGETSYLVVTGPGTAFGDGTTGPAASDFTDGTSNTIMFVEADQSVAWTKPDDYQFDPNNPRQGLGGLRPSGFLATFADIRTAFIQNDTDPNVLKALMTREGREVLNPLDE
jgi:hypothetical protein